VHETVFPQPPKRPPMNSLLRPAEIVMISFSDDMRPEFTVFWGNNR
jgi:hypothetical protein